METGNKMESIGKRKWFGKAEKNSEIGRGAYRRTGEENQKAMGKGTESERQSGKRH